LLSVLMEIDATVKNNTMHELDL